MTRLTTHSLPGNIHQVATGLHASGPGGAQLNEQERREILLLQQVAGRASQRRQSGKQPPVGNHAARIRSLLPAAPQAVARTVAKPVAPTESALALPTYIRFPVTDLKTLHRQGAPSGQAVPRRPMAIQVAGYDKRNKIFRMVREETASHSQSGTASHANPPSMARSSARLNFLRGVDRRSAVTSASTEAARAPTNPGDAAKS